MRGSQFILWLLSLIGALNCLGVAILFANEQPGSLWPAPGIYLVEIAILGIAGLIHESIELSGRPVNWSSVPWLIAGALLAFVILGGFSIGPFLIPATVAFGVSGVITDRWQGRSIVNHIILSLLVMIAQGALVLALIPIINS